ncbi:MAG TPA: prolyl oligopeptidase family serine peptidase [Longimicrobiales bacterium]
MRRLGFGPWLRACAARAARAARPALLLLLLPAAASARQKPALTPADYGKWESLGFGRLSPDGEWLAYPVSRVNERDELRIRRLDEDSTRAVAYGTRPVFSADGRWLAYGIGVSEDEREKLQKAKKPVHNRLGLLNLETGETITIDDVASFAFSDDGAFLAMRGYAIEGRDSKGVDLVVRELATGLDTNFGNVSDYAWQEGGTLLAMTIDAESNVGNGVLLYDPASGRLRTLDSDTATYIGPVWREDGDDLAVLRVRTDSLHEDETHVVLAWTGLAGEHPQRHVFDPATAEGFPAEMRIVDFRPLHWAEDGDAVFFGIKEWDRKPAEPDLLAKGTGAGDGRAAEDSATAAKAAGSADSAEAGRAGKEAAGDDEEPAGVEVWHARDVDIMPRQKVQADSDRRENHLAVWHLDSGRFVRLGTELTEDVELVEGDEVALGMDQTPYERERMFGPIYHDIYRIDVGSGERERIAERVQFEFGASPGGRYFLYLADDHYWIYDLETGARTNITAGIPTSFVDLEDDHTVEQKPPFGVAGWTEGDERVILYDKYDLWAVSPDGSGAVRLTRGAEDSVRHRLVRLDAEQEFIDPDEPLYLSLYGEWTKRFGYGRLEIGGDVDRLVWLDKNVSRLARADSADVFAYVVQDFDDSPDYFVAGPDLDDARQVTETNPFQDDYAWGHSELVEFENARGQRLQGALFYPANYEPGRKYPMIVYIYEIRSNTVHSYSVPSERSPYNPAVFTSEGYFVFQPDIVYRDRNPGLSAVESVVPAVEKVLETGMIDPARVGLVGHSWGAYQTAFIVTQTDLFSAAVAGAPLTDLISMYLSVYWNSGGTDARIFEISQGRMEVPFWEDLEAYMANSPLFNIQNMNTPLLVAFGDDDGAVDWHQGIELYNAARRAGKEFVMLVYADENHGLRKEPNQLDYHRRILEWFGHYLNGEAAPAWITDGVSYLERQKALEREGGR